MTTCSTTQIDSNPYASAICAKATANSGLSTGAAAYGGMMPNFILSLLSAQRRERDRTRGCGSPAEEPAHEALDLAGALGRVREPVRLGLALARFDQNRLADAELAHPVGAAVARADAALFYAAERQRRHAGGNEAFVDAG